MAHKKCSSCKIVKSFSSFRNDRHTKTGKTGRCKSCLKSYYSKTKKLLTKEERKKAFSKALGKINLVDDFGTIIGKQCSRCKDLKLLEHFNKCVNGYLGKRADCRLCVKKYDKSRYIPNPRPYNGTKEQVRRQRERMRRKEDPIWKVSKNISRNIRNALKKRKTIKDCKTTEILGCSAPEFWNHLCGTFEENYGISREWLSSFNYHIDHVIPISKAVTKSEVYALNHYTNLQLLIEEDNRKKSNKINWSLT